MLPAILCTFCFSISVICAGRSAKLIGGLEANFWRLACAIFFLSLWAWTVGQGLSGVSFPDFFLSGLVGIGVGDVALFQTLPRLGSRLTLVLVNCLTAPFGAIIEWLWLGTRLTSTQIFFGSIILIGIAISLVPGKNSPIAKKELMPGMLFGILAALGGAIGAVLSRKAYKVAGLANELPDGATAAYQRLMGGILVGGFCLLISKWKSIRSHLLQSGQVAHLSPLEKWRRVWPWVLANSLAGQTIGVSCYQWAFQTMPTGVVLPIVATTPLVAIPFSKLIEKETPSLRSIVGGIIAVTGVIGLALAR